MDPQAELLRGAAEEYAAAHPPVPYRPLYPSSGDSKARGWYVIRREPPEERQRPL